MVELLPFAGLLQASRKVRFWLHNHILHLMSLKRFLPRDSTAHDVDVFADELIAVHVDSSIDIDRIRRYGPDQVPTPYVRLRKSWPTDTICLHILHGFDGNADHIL